VGLYRDEGVVLRTQKLGEADRIVTLLTRRHGLVRAVAKGVRRTTSRFGARLEPFSTSTASSPRAARSTSHPVEAMGVHGRAISADYSAYTSGP
jgi:DNA repair protein RecO (recombination protein O)